MKKNLILPLFIITIMVLSVLGYSIGSSTKSNKIKYKDYTFIQTDQGWVTYINNQQLFLFNNPNEISNISVPVKLSELNSASKIYLTLDMENNIDSVFPLFQNIFPILTPRIVTACIKDSEKCSDLPLKNCTDATFSNKIIQIQYSENSSMNYKNNCFLIQGATKDLIKQIEALTLNYRLWNLTIQQS